MEKDNLVRTAVAGLIGLLVLFAVIMTLPRTVFEARGILLPSKDSMVTTENFSPSQEITFYDNANFSYKGLGTIRVSRHYSTNDTSQIEIQILQKAKELAAQAGANGVNVRLFAHTLMDRTPKELAVYTLWGEAIRK